MAAREVDDRKIEIRVLGLMNLIGEFSSKDVRGRKRVGEKIIHGREEKRLLKLGLGFLSG